MSEVPGPPPGSKPQVEGDLAYETDNVKTNAAHFLKFMNESLGKCRLRMLASFSPPSPQVRKQESVDLCSNF